MSIIDYRAECHVLVAVKGHPYRRDAFFDMFESFDGIAYSAVEQPAAELFFTPEHAAGFDAFVSYDMPGIDFSQQPPALVVPPPAYQQGFLDLLERGHGFVFLHHAIAAWPLWPEYAEIVGGRFLYRPATVRGRERLDSGYRHAVDHRIEVLAEHPVTEGVEPVFDITDELYLYEVFDDSVVPLLASDYRFEPDNFSSAYRAVTGHPDSNDDWPHPPGSNLVGWVKHYRNSPIVYLQCGDAPDAYANPQFRRLLANAIGWVSSDEARAWARQQNRGGSK